MCTGHLQNILIIIWVDECGQEVRDNVKKNIAEVKFIKSYKNYIFLLQNGYQI